MKAITNTFSCVLFGSLYKTLTIEPVTMAQPKKTKTTFRQGGNAGAYMSPNSKSRNATSTTQNNAKVMEPPKKDTKATLANTKAVNTLVGNDLNFDSSGFSGN